MSVAINSLIQRKAGQPSEQREAARNAAPTVGHTQGEQGLCAHSLGDTWPYRVVGKPDDTWELHRNGSEARLSGLDITAAHEWACYLAGRERERQAYLLMSEAKWALNYGGSPRRLIATLRGEHHGLTP